MGTVAVAAVKVGLGTRSQAERVSFGFAYLVATFAIEQLAVVVAIVEQESQ